MDINQITPQEMADKIRLRSEYYDNPTSYLKGVKVTLLGLGYDDKFVREVVDILQDMDVFYGYKGYVFTPTEYFIDNHSIVCDFLGKKKEKATSNNSPYPTIEVRVEILDTGQMYVSNMDDTDITELLQPSEKDMFWKEMFNVFWNDDEFREEATTFFNK